MAIKRSIKKVEIGDDSVVDLKFKDKSATATVDGANFKVHRINSISPNPMDVMNGYVGPASFDKEIRSPKFDADELHQRMESFAEKLEKAVIKVSPNEHFHQSNSLAAEPKELIKVKFDKFVQLVASRDFIAVLEKNKNEDIIMSSNLLTDLAGAIEEKSEKKTPVIFLVGLAIGVVITYLLINR